MNTNTIGLPSIITIVFVILKLVGVIAWSWWWVFSPLWIALGIAAVVIGIFCIFMAIDDAINR